MNKPVDNLDHNPNQKAVIDFCETHFKDNWGLNVYSDNDVDTFIVIAVPSKLYGKHSSLVTGASIEHTMAVVNKIKTTEQLS
jgi:hypothetical protein